MLHTSRRIHQVTGTDPANVTGVMNKILLQPEVANQSSAMGSALVTGNGFILRRKEFIAGRAQSGEASNMHVEFCRVNDAQRIWGLKRGLVYRKINDGTIRSITLRERGKKFGVRLLHVDSIRSWLVSELEAQESRTAVTG